MIWKYHITYVIFEIFHCLDTRRLNKVEENTNAAHSEWKASDDWQPCKRQVLHLSVTVI